MYYFQVGGKWFYWSAAQTVGQLAVWEDHDGLNYFWEAAATWEHEELGLKEEVSLWEFLLWSKARNVELLEELPEAAYAAADEAFGSVCSSFATLLEGGSLHPEDPARN